MTMVISCILIGLNRNIEPAQNQSWTLWCKSKLSSFNHDL